MGNPGEEMRCQTKSSGRLRAVVWCCLGIVLLWSWEAAAGQTSCSPNRQAGALCVDQRTPTKVAQRSSKRPPKAPSGASGRIIGGWLLFGLGAALVGTSSALFGVMATQGNELNLNRKAHSDGDCDLIRDRADAKWGPCADALAQLQQGQADYELLTGVAMGSFALGVAVLLTSAVILGLPEKSDKADKPPAAKPKAPPKTSGHAVILLRQQ